MLEEIVYTLLSLKNGNRYQLNYRTRKPDYQIDIVEYPTDIRFLRKCPPFSLLYRKPCRYWEVKKSETSVSQKEVADIFMKAKSLRIEPKYFTVITNSIFVDNVYGFLKEMQKESKSNEMRLIDGTGLTSMIIRSKMYKRLAKAAKDKIQTKHSIMPFDSMVYAYVQYLKK